MMDVLAAPALHPSLAERTRAGSAWLPAVATCVGIGLLLVAFADARSRAEDSYAETLFWLGMLAIVMPVTARMAAVSTSRNERIGLVTVLGLGLYLVKIMHSPVAFTFPDELIQLYNTRQIVETGTLFSPNSVLPITPYYPGISLVAAVLGELTALPTFGAALLIMGAARLVLIWSLYLCHEEVSGSSRVAGIASVLYATNPNFVFVGAGFIYESLALPLAMVALYAVVRRTNRDETHLRVGLTVVAIAAIMTVTVTHHVTSWALLACLIAVAAYATVRRLILSTTGPVKKHPLTWGLALLCGIVVLAWLIYVARFTVGYLAPVFSGALISVLRLIASEETGRQAFQSASGQVAPLGEQIVGVASVLLIVLGLPFGLWQVVRRHLDNPFAATLAGAALLYFPMLGLRLTPAGWETGHRSSEFLYIGISLVLALGLVRLRIPAVRWLAPVVIASYVAVVFAGGLIAGFPSSLRLPPPYMTSVAGQPIEPESVVAARWTKTALGPGLRFAASNSDANLLLAYGGQDALWGSNLGLQSMFMAPDINQSVIDILQTSGAQYLFTDRRRISWDLMFGMYVNSSVEQADPRARLIEPSAVSKFEKIDGASRVFDSGNVVIFDVGGVASASAR
jgi:hypothetical protein